jgi:hypothetical protein
MKTFNNDAAQGDIYIRVVDAIPPGAVRRESKGGRVIVAHSETGHHHYLVAAGVEVWESPSDPLTCYLRVDAPSALLEHARPWDTHEALELRRGIYEIRRQEELTPEGWVRVQD